MTTTVGRGAVEDRYSVFPPELQEALRSFSSRGGSLLVSGAYIGTDVWSGIYPVATDSLLRESTERFVEEVLGYRWLTNHGTYTGQAAPMRNSMMDLDGCLVGICREIGAETYCVENPDGIVPAGSDAVTVLRYTLNDVPAAVCADKGGYKVVSFGFPLETVTDRATMDTLFRKALEFFRK